MSLEINNTNSGNTSISGVTLNIRGNVDGSNLTVGSGNVQVIETNNNYGRLDGFERTANNTNNGDTSINGVNIDIGGDAKGSNLTVGSGNVQVIETNNKKEPTDTKTVTDKTKKLTTKMPEISSENAATVGRPVGEIRTTKVGNDSFTKYLDRANRQQNVTKWINLQSGPQRNIAGKQTAYNPAQRIQDALKDELTPEQLANVAEFGGNYREVEKYLWSLGITHIGFCF